MYKIPWDYKDLNDTNFYPPEEYQISLVDVNYITGKEEILHYSSGNNYNTRSIFFDENLYDLY